MKEKGSHTDPSNYRPISLTCVYCKLVEHAISSAITDHLNHHNIMCKEQHGFRKCRSCETQLSEAFNDLSSYLNVGIQTDLLLLDFSMTFDTVSHKHLLNKLCHYGINVQLHNCINAGHQQQLILSTGSSTFCDVLSSVPQGSILGPLLFFNLQ